MAGFTSDDQGGARRLADQLHAAATGLAELDPATAEAGRVVIAAAQPPTRTGAMAAGQVVRPTPGGVELISTVPYWTFVHFGAPRAGTRAQPWIADALTRTTDQILDVYAAHVEHTMSTIRG